VFRDSFIASPIMSSLENRSVSIVQNAIARLVLTGFMGAGKTTVGGELARRLDWTFLDLDREIERRNDRSISRIFAEEGESGFRRLESLALVSVLARRRMVLALGGGTPEELRNKLLLEQTPGTAVIHLAAPFTILVERCLREDGLSSRPVLGDLDHAEKRFHTRHRVYQRLAKHTIDTSELDVTSIVDSILKYLETSR
jgi:shikimate kinase